MHLAKMYGKELLAEQGGEGSEGSEGQERQGPRRLHFLDWLRLLMVAGVVYTHTAKSGITGGGGFDEAWLVDDRSLFDHRNYAEMYAHLDSSSGYRGPVSGQCAPTNSANRSQPAAHPAKPRRGRSPLNVRWISIARQFCLPLLFWVSGASVACSYRGGVPRGLDKLAAFTALGMAANACLWFLGPLDDSCFVDNPDCSGKGLVFSFTIVPWAGSAFAILFQMWYTVVLTVLSLLNWPLLAASYNEDAQPWLLPIQWLLNMAFYAGFILKAGATCALPGLALGLLAVLEAMFLALTALGAPALADNRPDWLPVRGLHYLLAGVALVQFGAVPYAESMHTIGFAYVAYIFVGFNRFFQLGFLLTRARLSAEGDLVEPLVSRAWPLGLVLCIGVAPSTNWDLAGMLTYPFYVNILDRCLYVAGAVTVMFLLDRFSRVMVCDALPQVLGHASLVLYLTHPVLITLFLSMGLRSVPIIWLCCAVVAISLAAFLGRLQTLGSKGAKEDVDGGETE
mmetsp:Transcript_83291/g.236031  ORF Transcript_83291/g.236031 Transcript_83291/m.236031 type:complete len:510 (+) Transcript_83291:36-1565(+)